MKESITSITKDKGIRLKRDPNIIKTDILSLPDQMSSYDTFTGVDASFTHSESVNLSFNEVNTQYTGQSIVRHDSNFGQAMFNFMKSFLGIGVVSISSCVKRAGIVNASIAILFTSSLSIIGTNLTISAREKLLKIYKNGPTSSIMLPVALYWKAYGDAVPKWELAIYLLICIVSGVMGFISFVATIIDEIDTH